MAWLNEIAMAFSLTLGFILVVQTCVYAIRRLYEPQDDEPEDPDAPVLTGPTAPLPPHRTFTEVTIGPDGKYLGTISDGARLEVDFDAASGTTLLEAMDRFAYLPVRIYEPPEEGVSDDDSR